MIQYIRKNNQPVGLYYAEKVDGELKIGFSLLNPDDIEETKKYNCLVKQANAESYRQRNIFDKGPEEAPIEQYRPFFDKKVAVEVAKKRASNNLVFYRLPLKVQRTILDFIPLAIRHLGGEVLVKF